MQRAREHQSVRFQTIKGKKNSHRVLLAASAAAITGVAMVNVNWAPAATTLTWVGNVVDPSSPGGAGSYTPSPAYINATLDTPPANPYGWNSNNATNWVGGSYSQGSNVVFTDNFAGGTAIRLSNSALNPASMTFSHIAGATPTNYVFLAGGDYTWNAGANSLSSSSPFGTGNTFGSTLTLDTGFLGKVELRSGSSNVTSGTPNTIVRSGILQLDTSNTVPATNNQKPNIELGGGQLWINGSLASSQLAGTLTVSDNSILALASSTTDARLYNGVVNVSAGKTLTIESIYGFVPRFSTGTFTGALSQGTIKLVDVGANVTKLELDSASGDNVANNVTWDLGTGQSQLWMNATGTFQMGALTGGANTFLRGPSSLTASETLTVGSKNIDTTFAGGISDTTVGATLNFVKSGNGTLVLSGGGGTGSGWTGSTTVSGGTLVLSGPNGAQNAASGTTIGLSSTLKLDNSAGNNSNRLPDGTGTRVTMNGGRLIFVGDLATPTAELAGQLRLGSGASHVQAIASGVGGTATLTFNDLASPSGGGTVDFAPVAGVNINFTNAPTLTNGILGGFATTNDTDWATITGGNNTVTTYSGYTPAANGSDPSTWLATDNINVTATSGLTVAAASVANSIKFSGSGGNISINSGQVLSVVSGGLLVPAGSGLSPTISGLGNLTAGSAATVASLYARVPDASSTLTISAPIVDNTGGTVSLVKAGAGKLVLGGGNSYTGGTFLQEGTLVAGAVNLFGPAATLSIANNTTFDIGGFNQTLGTVTLVSGALVNTGGAASVTSTGGYNVQDGTISANIGGTVALTKSTAGTVILSGASNNYSGGTNVTSGTLQVTSNNGLGGGALVVNGNSTLDITSTSQTVSAVSVGSGGTATGTIIGTGVLTSTSAYDMQNGTVNAQLAGSVGLGKNGIIKSSVVLGNSGNTYTGATTINGLGANSPDGELRISHLADGNQPSSIGASSNAASNLILNGGNLVYVGAGDTTDRGLTLSANSRIVNSGSGPLVFTNTGAISTAGGSTLWLQGGNTGNNSFAMAIVGSGTNFNKSDAGTWILTNEGSTYDGITSIFGGGILSVSKIVNGNAPSSIGQSSNDPGNLVFSNNGGTLKYTGLSTSTDRLITLNANATLDSSGSGPINWTNTSAIGGSGSVGINLTFGGSNTGNNIFSPAIGFGTSVVKSGSGTWTLNGALTYSGQTGAGTTVNGGTLILATNQTSQQDVNITLGKLQLASGGGALRVIKTPTLEITGTGQLDIQDNKLIVTSTPTGTWNGSAYTDLTGMIASGRSGATWTGGGIITGQAAAQNSNFTTVGIAQAQDVRPATATATGLWAGQTISGTDTLVMYTYGGDATLDGKINVDDYIRIDSGIAAGLTGWSNGDFNYDGKVNIDDYTQFIDANIGIQGAQFPTAGGFGGGGASGVSAVPEPATLSILGLGATALLARRRRRTARAMQM